jgi:nanoRNase/pAp phosphatase (c-di-AMP/oligoRNAs hydrolase)
MPDLIRHPASNVRIPAFAGMTKVKVFRCRVNNFIMMTPKERIKRFYEQFKNDDRVLIPINADPDAIACAMAVKRLLWRKTAVICIVNVNEIKRPDNLTMIRLIQVPLIPVKSMDTSAFNRIVMVDSQPDHHKDLASFVPHVIIDHHPAGNSAKAPFQDIRPSYGATASILIEYLRAAKIKPSARLATGLYYAIKTDTSNFERQTLIEDLNAFQYIFKHTNIHMARRIEQAEMRMDFLKFFKLAIEERRVQKGHLYVHLGPVTHSDVCVQIADFFMRVDSVKSCVVSGSHQGKLVVIFRNDGIRSNAGIQAKKSFGQLGSAGGHKSTARAEIPLEAIAGLVDCKDRKKTAKWIFNQITRRAGRNI